MMEAGDVRETAGDQTTGGGTDDEHVLISTNKGQPVVLNQKSRAGQAFRNIAARITGSEVPFLDMSQKDDFMTIDYRSIWQGRVTMLIG